MYDQSIQRRRHTCSLRYACRQALASAAALVLSLSLAAQDYPNGLAVNSLCPEADSVAFARIRAHMDNVRRTEHRPAVALSLCGGGAKGAAEVGALKYIVNELHIPVDFIAGTSIGGLLGGVMAMGYTVDDLEDLFRNQNWDVLLSDRTDIKFFRYSKKKYNSTYQLRVPFHLSAEESARRKAEGEFYDPNLHFGAKAKESTGFLNSLPLGYVYGFNVGNLLSSLSVGYQDSTDFCNLPVPFMCTSSDLVSCKAYNFSSGSIKTAMRATMSIPGVFSPIKGGGMVLADGGLQNNLPTDIALASGADYVIAIDITNAEANYSDIDNVADVLSQLIEISGRESYNRASGQGDSYIKVDVDGYSSMSFDAVSIDSLIARGYSAARADSMRLKAIAAAVAGRTVSHVKRQKDGATDIRKRKVEIGSVSFRGLSEDESRILTSELEVHPGDSVDASILSEIASSMQATGNYEHVSYSLYGTGEPYDLVFECRQGPVHRIGVGIRLDTEEWVAVALNLGLNVNRLSGSKYDFSARVGASRQNFTAKYYYDIPAAPTINVDVNVNQSMGDILMGYTDGKPVSEIFEGASRENYRARYLSTGVRVYLSDINLKKLDFNVGLQNRYYQMMSSDLQRVLYGIDSSMLTEADLVGAFANLSLRTLDEQYYPSRGVNLHLGYSIDFCRPGNNDFKAVHSFIIDCLGVIPLGGRVSIVPDFHVRSLLDDNGRTFFAHANFVGGLLPGRFIEQQIPYVGSHRTFFTTNHVSVLNLFVRTMIVRNVYLSAFGGFLHAADSFPDYFSPNSYQDYSAGIEAAYNSIAGPIKASVSYSKYFGWGLNFSAGFDF